MKMKVKGEKGKAKSISDFKDRTEFTLKTVHGPVKLKITSLPLGFQQQMGEQLPIPQPPKKPVKVDGKVRKDHKGNVQMAPDREDPEWKEVAERMNRLHQVAAVYHCLEDNKDLEWDTKVEDYTKPGKGFDAEKFYTAIEEEFARAKFQSGSFMEIFKLSFQVSGFDLDEMKELQSFFLSARLGV